MNIEKYVLLKKQSLNAGNQRIFTQLDYAVQLVKIDGKYTDVFNKGVDYLCSCPVIGSAEVKECEGILSPMQAFAKSFESPDTHSKTMFCHAPNARDETNGNL